jgi:hypothetical protein
LPLTGNLARDTTIGASVLVKRMRQPLNLAKINLG